MKKNRLAILAIATTLVIGGTIMTVQNKSLFTDGTKQEKKKEQDPHEKQLAYLKKHEEEIKEFVKSQNSKIESVQMIGIKRAGKMWKWNSTRRRGSCEYIW